MTSTATLPVDAPFAIVLPTYAPTAKRTLGLPARRAGYYPTSTTVYPESAM